MGYFSFPHTRSYDSDLGWIIKKIIETDQKLTEYLENAIITIADPIAWSIVSQYPSYTMVIDNEGTAYLSKQPVPAGITLDNETYWQPIFNYDQITDAIIDSIALNVGTSSTTPTALYVADLIYKDSLLYYVQTDLAAGSQLIPGDNITRTTVAQALQAVRSMLLSYVRQLQADDEKIRGNIAYNEGTSETASRAYAAGDLIWINGNLYYAQTALPIGTRFIIGSNVTKTTIEYIIKDIRSIIVSTVDNAVQPLAEQISEIGSGIDYSNKKLSERDFLMIGDSYGDEAGEWPYRVKTMLGLTDDNCHILCEGGSGFISNGQLLFINQLINYTGDRTKVSDIIICGGLNDSFSTDIQAQWWSDLRVNMSAVNDYIKANYPNATTWLGYIGNGIDGAEALGARMYAARRLCEYYYYQYAMDFNWRVLHGVEIALTSSRYNIASDGVHPSAFGSLALSQAIAQSLLTNNVTIAYPATAGASIKSPYTGQMGLTYTQENYDTVLHIRSNFIRVSSGTVLQPQIVIGELTNLYFNKEFDCNVTVRLDAFNNLPYIFLPARLYFNKSNMTIELFGADTAGAYIAQYTAGANAFIRIMDCDILTKSIYLA